MLTLFPYEEPLLLSNPQEAMVIEAWPESFVTSLYQINFQTITGVILGKTKIGGMLPGNDPKETGTGPQFQIGDLAVRHVLPDATENKLGYKMHPLRNWTNAAGLAIVIGAVNFPEGYMSECSDLDNVIEGVSLDALGGDITSLQMSVANYLRDLGQQHIYVETPDGNSHALTDVKLTLKTPVVSVVP